MQQTDPHTSASIHIDAYIYKKQLLQCVYTNDQLALVRWLDREFYSNSSQILSTFFYTWQIVHIDA